ncbi:hypothetical protein [Spiroplasma poulsonii]|uniref:hypothetical protein n=1 Tax=Spiroplasma poulsonii TaxID=2138 RepID=UPI000589CE2A|nr:hypothetical protein [Spiroplasma poulsonii]
MQQIPASAASSSYNNDNFNGGKKAKNVVIVLDENTQGGLLHTGDSYIGTNNGVILNYAQKGEKVITLQIWIFQSLILQQTVKVEFFLLIILVRFII